MWVEIERINNVSRIKKEFPIRESVENYLNTNPTANIIEVNMSFYKFLNAMNNVPLNYWNRNAISKEGLTLIKEFIASNYDSKLFGKLITKHNEEKWSDIVYCCGGQLEQIKMIIDGMGF